MLQRRPLAEGMRVWCRHGPVGSTERLGEPSREVGKSLVEGHQYIQGTRSCPSRGHTEGSCGRSPPHSESRSSQVHRKPSSEGHIGSHIQRGCASEVLIISGNHLTMGASCVRPATALWSLESNSSNTLCWSGGLWQRGCEWVAGTGWCGSRERLGKSSREAGKPLV